MTFSQNKEIHTHPSSLWLQDYNTLKEKPPNQKGHFSVIFHFLKVCTFRKLQVTFPTATRFAAFPGKITIQSSAESTSALAWVCRCCSPWHRAPHTPQTHSSGSYCSAFHILIMAWSTQCAPCSLRSISLLKDDEAGLHSLPSPRKTLLPPPACSTKPGRAIHPIAAVQEILRHSSYSRWCKASGKYTGALAKLWFISFMPTCALPQRLHCSCGSNPQQRHSSICLYTSILHFCAKPFRWADVAYRWRRSEVCSTSFSYCKWHENRKPQMPCKTLSKEKHH